LGNFLHDKINDNADNADNFKMLKANYMLIKLL